MNSPDPPEVTPATSRCLVIGASGYIGSNLVPYLLERGLAVRAVSRSPGVLEARGWQGVQIVAASTA